MSLPEKRKEYPRQVLWILVNKVDSKMHVTSGFHNKWKTDSGRDDKNVIIITDKENDDSIQTDF